MGVSRKDIIDDVMRQATGLTRRQVTAVIRAYEAAIQGELADGNRVMLTGFGAFDSRPGRLIEQYDLRLGRVVQRQGTTRVLFQPSGNLKELVNGKPVDWDKLDW